MRLLPNGNYVIAGTNTDKHLIMAKRGNLPKSPTRLKNVGHRSHGGSSLIASGGNRPPTLVKMAATSSPMSANKRRLSDISATTSETSSMSKGKGRGKKAIATAMVTSAPIPQRVRPVSQRKVSIKFFLIKNDLIVSKWPYCIKI